MKKLLLVGVVLVGACNGLPKECQEARKLTNDFCEDSKAKGMESATRACQNMLADTDKYYSELKASNKTEAEKEEACKKELETAKKLSK